MRKALHWWYSAWAEIGLRCVIRMCRGTGVDPIDVCEVVINSKLEYQPFLSGTGLNWGDEITWRWLRDCAEVIVPQMPEVDDV